MNAAQQCPMVSLLLIFGSAAVTGNILLTRFLGVCPVIGAARRLQGAWRLGVAVLFTTVAATPLNWTVYHRLLVPLSRRVPDEFAESILSLRIVVFIIAIVLLVEMLEMLLDRYLPRVHGAYGGYASLVIVNCAVLGVSLIVAGRDYGLGQALIYGLGAAVGWMLALLVIAGICARLDHARVPESMRGPAIVLLIAGILSLILMGFRGVL